MQKQTIGIIVSVSGLALLVIGVLLGWVIAPKIIKNKIEKETRLEEGSDTYEKWLDLPVPIRLKFYFFHVVNADELIESYKSGNPKVIPILKEVGPYSYLQKRVKYDIRRSEEDDTIFYKQNITYHFDRETSAGDEDDLVTVANMPLITLLNLLTVTAPSFGEAVYATLGPEEVFHKVEVGQLAVSGIPLPQYSIAVEMADFIGMQLPNEFQDGKFGLYLPRNNSNDGEFEVYTGITDSSKFNIIKTVEGNGSVDFWEGEYCNMINGTDGTMFPPFIKKSTILRVYPAEICRSIHLTYKEKVKFNGIPGYRFSLPAEFFENPYKNLDNMCFCTPPPSQDLNDTCDMSGAIRIHTCKHGAPVILSKPHFLDADPTIRAEISGLTPNSALHDSQIDVEPNSGFPLEIYKRVQLSLEMQPMIWFKKFENLPHMLFPVAWASEEAALTDELIDELKSRLVKPMQIVDISKWTLIGVGCALVVASAIILIFFRK